MMDRWSFLRMGLLAPLARLFRPSAPAAPLPVVVPAPEPSRTHAHWADNTYTMTVTGNDGTIWIYMPAAEPEPDGWVYTWMRP